MPYSIDDSYESKSENSRVRFLVLHYTVFNMRDSLDVLTKENSVSAHYLVSERGERVYRLVDESRRAWHSGVSAWENRTNINDSSVGIEIVHPGYTGAPAEPVWHPFDENQISTVISLCKDIVARHEIEPTRIIGHSDIAPGRKVDPGPMFPWKILSENGVGAWYDEAEKLSVMDMIVGTSEVDIRWVQQNLRRYGYLIEESGTFDKKTKAVLSAFQMHFRPSDFSGNPDHETCAILYALVKKYFPNQSLTLPCAVQSEEKAGAFRMFSTGK